MRIDTPDPGEADVLAELWTDLAGDQRRHGSHLQGDANRAVVRQDIASHAAVDGLRVAYDPTPVGFVMFDRERDRYDRSVTRGIVRNLYVQPDRRGEGVGSALLDAAERALAEAGVDVVALEAMADNERARRFYERHGYSPHRVVYERPVETDTRDGG